MGHAKHRNVPAGTVADWEGMPRTVLRDYDTVVIPAMQLDAAGLEALVAALAGVSEDMAACAAELAEG